MAVSMRAAKGVRLGSCSSVRSVRPARGAIVCQAQRTQWGGAAAAAAAAAASLIVGSAGAISFNELQSLTYTQVKGSGIAGSCPVIESGSTNLRDLRGGNYTLEKFCLEPTKFQVKEESSKGEAEFVDTKLLTRLTYALDEIAASFNVSGSNVELKEQDGIDYAAVTVQLPGGERVPFLFSMKELQAKGSLENFTGEFIVPSYRGTTFLDPKGRGASTGYDASLALPARSDDEELFKENIKSAASGKGTAAFSVAKVDSSTGEIAGVFESIQPSDTDLGSKQPKDVKIVGIWYGQLK